MPRAPDCAVIVLLSICGLYHGGGALSPPRIQNYARPAPNIALNGISTQSSTNSYFGNAQNAIDGSLAANYLRSQCSFTKKESEPWWMVNLKAPHRVISVAITNRVLECCRERLFGAEIRIGNNSSNGGKLNARCGVVSSIESGETLSFSCQGMVGQYVTVTIPGREEHLIMCEVQVFGFPIDGSENVAAPKDLKTPNGAPNVAPKGIAQQSTTYNMYGEPKNAIDGSLSSNYLDIQCAGTSEQKNPWWMVDLKSKYKIFTVAITNRGDCCAERINGAEIKIGNSGENGGTKNPICGVITSMEYGQTLAFECDGMVGQYVTVYIPGAARSVTICEVQVFGLPSAVAGDNLAFRGIASQSSTYDKFGASENAIDGSPSAIYMSGHCSHTDLDVEPWWRVDLMNTFNVTKVKITNRVDCCPERIKGAEIRIGNFPENGGTRNPTCAKIESLGRGKEEEYVCGMVGRYVTITIPGRAAYLTLCEVKVYGIAVSEGHTATPIKPETKPRTGVIRRPPKSDNLASGGITSQSSNYYYLGDSENAIDGNSNAIYMSGHCSHTLKDMEPWWMVDLRNTFNITKVKITNRACCCAERLNGAEIRIGNIPENGGIQNPRCAKIESLGRGKEEEYVCGMVGRYVTVTIPGRAEYLTLCEVKVYGTTVSEGYTVTQLGADVPAKTNLTGRHFLFPKESITDYVVLTPARPMRLNSFTLCMNLALNVSENRETILFSYRTLNYDALNLWVEYNGNIGLYMNEEGLKFPKIDSSKNWTHLCLTWESAHGRCELWVNGKRSGNKIYHWEGTVQPGGFVILGQDQDNFNGGFDENQSYIGKIKDLNMWNKVLSLKSLRSVFKGKVKQKGQIFDWSDLSYSIKGNAKLI